MARKTLALTVAFEVSLLMNRDVLLNQQLHIDPIVFHNLIPDLKVLPTDRVAVGKG